MQATLTDFMQTQPDGTLEEIATRYQVSLLKVINALPERTLVAGDQFDTVWEEITRWGSVTTLVHTEDIILEFKGDLPSGYHRHGYFNLRAKQGLSGHIKSTHCQHIALIERRFMAMPTASILFLNAQEQAMLKIFVGRDTHHQLLPEQLAAFRQLAVALSKGKQ